MKIINCGRGLHEREVKGIESLASLPQQWFAYTNLDLATAPGSSREIDVIIVADDRILVVDLKLESLGFAQGFLSSCELEALHFIGIRSFGEEFREDVAFWGIQEEFRKPLA